MNEKNVKNLTKAFNILMCVLMLSAAILITLTAIVVEIPSDYPIDKTVITCVTALFDSFVIGLFVYHQCTKECTKEPKQIQEKVFIEIDRVYHD